MTQVQKAWEKNIPLEYIFTFLFNLNFTRGLWMIYLAGKGMTLFQLGILESTFHVTSFLMEVPTGVVADLFSRKSSRIIGRVFTLVEVVIIVTGQSFSAFLLAFIVSALSYNFESGAGEALIYDSMKAIGKEHSFMKMTGHKELIYQLTSTCALIVGGVLATISYNLVYVVTFAAATVTLIESLFFYEPVKEKHKAVGITASMKNQVVESFGTFRSSPRILYLFFSVNSLMAFITTLFFYLQNYFKAQGYIESEIGVIMAAAGIAGAIFGVQAWRLEKLFGHRILLRALPLLICSGFALLAYTEFEILAFALLSGLEGILFVVTRDYINKLISSEQRATLLSIDSMVFSISMVVVFPVVGHVGDHFSLKIAFQMMGLTSFVITAVNLLFLKQLEKRES